VSRAAVELLVLRGLDCRPVGVAFHDVVVPGLTHLAFEGELLGRDRRRLLSGLQRLDADRVVPAAVELGGTLERRHVIVMELVEGHGARA